MMERYLLAKERIRESLEEHSADDYGCTEIDKFFRKTAAFIITITEVYHDILEGRLEEYSLEELEELNRGLFSDILPEQYGHCYANPEYAVQCLGEDYGKLFSFLYTELRSLTAYVFEKDLEEMTIRMELFLEIYGAVSSSLSDSRRLPAYEELRQIIYWFVHDYSEQETLKRQRSMLCEGDGFVPEILERSQSGDLRYVYFYGEYITENERKTAEYLNSLEEETIQKMADAYTEGYRIGFLAGGKDISKKKVVNIRYALGFERMIYAAVKNFRKMGLSPAFYRAGNTVFHGRSMDKNGYFGASPNRQYEYDHREDQALFWDRQYLNRRLEGLRAAYEELKKEARLFAGPAVLETFGETPFEPEQCPGALRLDEKQQKLLIEYMSAAGAMQNEYMPREERSFTIIAFPVPEIGPEFAQIFREVITINTLDYREYQQMQQCIIDGLDQAEYIRIKGTGENRTDLKVCLQKLKDPAGETNFENCVADVNIPVGEVFTSPRLKGTEGTLHVSRGFLKGLEYRNLEIVFREGMTESYSCSNFEDPEEGKKYIRENLLFHHEQLPMGEFAIGTNTTAYVMAKKYDIGHLLPILIAEKTGPHFAIGDTCYSHEEDTMTYNPDGKAITARENEISALRHKDASEAYFHCHTDITLPYDELELLEGVTPEGERIPVIRDGRFVMEGCEALNLPLDAERRRLRKSTEQEEQ